MASDEAARYTAVMYLLFLTLHSWLRWAVLALAVVACATAWLGWLGKKQWRDDQRSRVQLPFIIAADLQLLVGVVLFGVLSPMTQAAFSDFGGAMKSGALRFWSVEHTALMLLAIVFAHLGQALSKRGVTPTARFRRAAVFFSLALAMFLVGIPWPGLSELARPLFRLN